MQHHIFKYTLYKILFFLTYIYVNFSLIFKINYWRKKEHNTTSTVLCFGGVTTYKDKNKNWVNTLSTLLNTTALDLSLNTTANELIVERAISYQQRYIKPEAIFILFEEINNISIFLNHNTVGVYDYEEIAFKTMANNTKENTLFPYGIMYNIDNLFFQFIKNLELVTMYCEYNGIKLYWFTTSKVLNKLPDSFFPSTVRQRSLFKNGKLYCINKHDIGTVLPYNFAKLYNNI